MLIITDKVLQDSGLDYALAFALMEPAEGELVVHVKQILDGAPPPALPDFTEESGSGPEDLDPVPLGETEPVEVGATPSATRPAEKPPERDYFQQPEHMGYSQGMVERMAEDQRLTLTRHGDFYKLTGAFGQRHYMVLSQVVAALMLRRFA